MSVKRQDIADIAKSWKGLKETDGSFKPIVDIYNSIVPLPRNYKLKYTDSWKAGTVSAAYNQADAAAMFPCECSCAAMIQRAQQMFLWVEKEGYQPKLGDVCAYTWQDCEDGDKMSVPEHIGIVVDSDKASKTFVVIEGDVDSVVESRTLSTTSKFIRGFISPIFDEDCPQASLSDEIPTVTTTASTPTVYTSPSCSMGTGTLSKVAAGTKLKLDETPMYASPSASNISCLKTGAYYIWGVDTINQRVRITNAKCNVGVKGQVTGWIDVATAIKLVVETTPTTASADTPVYQVNAVYVVQLDDVPVLKGPGTNYEKVGYSGLTANAKKYDKNKTGNLFRNVKVTCLDVKVIGSNVWMRIPSGWVAAYYDKKYYIK